jgi:alkylhydroperoxidase family enzyme
MPRRRGEPHDDAGRVLSAPVPLAAQAGKCQLPELIWTIAVINAWNRLGATARPWPLS